jgi:DNA-binding FadR family transcriptional regulator
MTKLRTYPRRGLHGALVHDIGARSVRGERAPGELVPVEALSGEPPVSRTVVREAIKVLTAKRLVEARPNTGTRVRPRRDWNLLDPDVLAWQVEAGPDREFLRQAAELRRVIEPAAARLAAERRTAEEVAALRDACAEMAAAGDDLDAFIGPDLRFHRLLLKTCHNDLLEHIGEVFIPVLRTMFSYAHGAFRSAAALRNHEAILAAIEARDSDAAERAFRQLIDDAEAGLTWRPSATKKA